MGGAPTSPTASTPPIDDPADSGGNGRGDGAPVSAASAQQHNAAEWNR